MNTQQTNSQQGVFILDTSGVVQSTIYANPGARIEGIFQILLANPNAVVAQDPNLAVIIDRSGSMSTDQKLEHAKDALRQVVNQVNDGTRMLIAWFSDGWGVLEVYRSSQTGSRFHNQGVLLNPVTQDFGSIVVDQSTRPFILQAIDQWDTIGSTCFSDAHLHVMSWLRTVNGPKNVVTLTDGNSTDTVRDDKVMPKFTQDLELLGGKHFYGAIGADANFQAFQTWTAGTASFVADINPGTGQLAALLSAVASKTNRAVFDNLSLAFIAMADIEIEDVEFKTSPVTVIPVTNPTRVEHKPGTMDKLLGIEYVIRMKYKSNVTPPIGNDQTVLLIEISYRDGTGKVGSDTLVLTVNITGDAALARKSMNMTAYNTLINTQGQGAAHTAMVTLSSGRALSANQMTQMQTMVNQPNIDPDLKDLIQTMLGGVGGQQQSQKLRTSYTRMVAANDPDFDKMFGGVGGKQS